MSAVKIPKGSFLVSFDVESLCTNISQEGGLEAMQYFLEIQREDLPVEFFICLN